MSKNPRYTFFTTKSSLRSHINIRLHDNKKCFNGKSGVIGIPATPEKKGRTNYPSPLITASCHFFK